MFNDVALPMSSPKGITVAPVTFKTAKEDSFNTVPPDSNWIRLKSVVSKFNSQLKSYENENLYDQIEKK